MGKKRTLADDLNRLQRKEDLKQAAQGLKSYGFRETVDAAYQTAKHDIKPYFAGTSPMREMGEKISFEGRRFGAGPIAKKGRKRKQA